MNPVDAADIDLAHEVGVEFDKIMREWAVRYPDPWAPPCPDPGRLLDRAWDVAPTIGDALQVLARSRYISPPDSPEGPGHHA